MSDIKLEANLELVDDLSFLESDKEAFASISLNPTFQWAKIVVTDDQPNANKNRVPLEEFENLIKTGIFAPIKMADSEISRGHQEAMGKPIGTIAQLVKIHNKIIALAALWKRERPDEIDLLRTMYKEGNPPNVSWELSYADSQLEDNGIEALRGISLNGLAVVNAPAYSGRTPFIAMASKDKDHSADSNDQSDKEDKIVNEDELKQKISELEAEIANLKTETASKDKELEDLRTFKKDVEAAQNRVARLEEIKKKFDEAKVQRDEKFWTEKSETLLNMDDASIDFMLQELVSFSANASVDHKVEIPNIPGSNDKKLSPSELGKALRERNIK